MIINIEIKVLVDNDCFLNENEEFDYGGQGEELLKDLIIEKIKSNSDYNNKQIIIDPNGNPVGYIQYKEEHADGAEDFI